MGNAAICLGLAQASYERALAFVKERHQFGGRRLETKRAIASVATS